MPSSLLALLDDIATVLDDVAVLTKVATKKTAGVLGDDLALNAEQVAGVRAERELPVVWAVAKGSALNKLILVPIALVISQFAPWAVVPLLMVGGAYLCYEAFEKVAHKLLHSRKEDAAHHKELVEAIADPDVDLVKLERDKIKGAIRTDFVLSAEIVVIALGTVADESFGMRVGVLCAISALMTIGVYGLVAGIVKLDDLGAGLKKRRGLGSRAIGSVILLTAPALMRLLAIAGTIAMFMVGGSILLHGITPLEEWLAQQVTGIDQVPSFLVSMATDFVVGLVAGLILVLVITLLKRVFRRKKKA